MSPTKEDRFDVVYSPIDITERTVIPRSKELSENFWSKFQSAAFDCPEALLLVWPIFGPLNEITVLDSTAVGEAFKNRQPFVTENPDGSKTFHPIASLPATYPLLSHITLSVGIFDDFRDVTGRMTELHEFDWAEVEEAKRAGVTKFYCHDEKCKPQPYLYMTQEPDLSIEAQEKPYVTIGEAVCAIHEWLLTLQEEILIAETALWDGDNWGCQAPMLPRDTKFWVSGLWGTDVIRQGGVGSGEQMPWDPEMGEGYPATEEEWEERLEMARKRREALRARGDGGHEPGMINVD
ncbi:hypothetical protein CORC01_01744 [Colletotrichum orchidophilum]|uniref:Uncharacterized protein n=1 Tax=Colletotrichum orchidophilum TaxID=1209926 RepID=A0A1G4BNW6_9PEZI|nr:uncharacterized protein CORC01_01744 [Colletotrichum orchidophilum]OHF02986.1 hypothetical protein CORC01_01744 [Colletotrichum orchidophilum]